MQLDNDPRRAGRARARRVGLVLLTACLLLGGWSVSAFGAVFQLDSVSNSTVAPGDTLTYFIEITNAVSDPTDGSPYTATIHLPSGITGMDAGNLDIFGDPNPNWTCTGDGPTPAPSVDGAQTIQCTSTNDLSPGNNIDSFIVDAAVDPAASGQLTATMDIAGGGAVPATTADPTTVTTAAPSFGIDAFDGQVSDSAGGAFSQAGGHPSAASTSIDFNSMTNPNPFIGPNWPVEPAKDVTVDLPPGFVGNPTVAPKCTAAELVGIFGHSSKPNCPAASQVGTTKVRVTTLGGTILGPLPVFNMVPQSNVPAQFGFNVAGVIVTLNAHLRSDSDYGLSVNVSNIPEGLDIVGTSLTFWGVPADGSHDGERSCPDQLPPVEGGPSCAAGISPAAFLRNPTACTAPGIGLLTGLSIDSWVHPGDFKHATFVSHDPPAYPLPPDQWGPQHGPDGCDRVAFDPVLTGTPDASAKAGSPTGFAFDLSIPQTTEPAETSESDLKKAVVTLPAGLRLSASAADGLGACSPDQIGLIGTGFPEPNPIHFNTNDPTCPDSSKVGTLTITTPLLDQQLTGSIYLATPHQNPFNSLVAIYLVAKGPGLIVKLPGKVQLDPQTGQITATFDNNPQLPFSNLHLEFFGGPRASLMAPQCGEQHIQSQLTGWSGKVVNLDSTFTIDHGADGGPCAPQGFAPGFAAGTENPVGGTSSPFDLRLTRGDGDQELASLAVNTPSGLLGRIADAVLCPDAAANAGTCQDVSKIGDVTVGAGAGSNPFYISSGKAYITGPYKGAPYGLSIVVPAVAGPFDLGNVVVRSAIFVDKATAALKVVSDPLPTILQGIPLDVRDVRVSIDKPQFIVNPTSCAEKHVFGTIASTAGAIAHVSDRFQVGECGNLALAPKLSLTVGARHHTQAGVSTPVTATLTMPKGDANLRVTSVTLPGTLNARLPVVNRACSLAAFEAGHCGNQSRAGTAVAVTPLLRDPLRGGVYFVKNPKRVLPDLMVALRGQVSLDVTAKVSIPGGKRLGTTFDTIPDAPITKFTLRIVSGKNGPVGIVTNLCSAKGRRTPASVAFRGQNGKVLKLNVPVHVNGCARAAKARRSRK